MAKRREHRESFVAVGEDGSEHTIDIYIHVFDVATFEDPSAELDGIKELRAEDGRRVNRIDKGVYEIVDTKERLTSADPAAP